MNTALQATTQTTVRSQEAWCERITAAWQKQVPAILETGNLLLLAKYELRGNWLRTAEKKLPFSISTANKLMKIAACDHFKDSELIPNLPANWAILFQLSLSSDLQFKIGIGTIHPKMTMKDAKALRGIEPREPDAKKETAMSILKRQVEEQTRTIAHLHDQLATAEAGSLYDLQKDSVKDCINVFMNDVHMRKITRSKATEFAKGILAALKGAAE